MANTLKTIMANTQEANAVMYEKKRKDKEATSAAYITLTKEDIEVRRMDAEAMKLAEETWIMLADMSNMNPSSAPGSSRSRPKSACARHDRLAIANMVSKKRS